MTTSTDAKICFGIDLEGIENIPWEENYPYDIEKWWMRENGYEPLYEIYDENEDWLPDVTKEMVDEYYVHKRNFKKNIPSLPVDLVYHCHDEDTMYILAVKGTEIVANRGEVVEIPPLVVPEKELLAFNEFVKKYIKNAGKPKWCLVSYWG